MENKFKKVDLTEIDGELIYRLSVIAYRTGLLKYNLNTLEVYEDFIKVEADTSTGLAEIEASLNNEKITICVKNKEIGMSAYYHTIKLSDEVALNISYINELIIEEELYRIDGCGLLDVLTPLDSEYTLKLEKNTKRL